MNMRKISVMILGLSLLSQAASAKEYFYCPNAEDIKWVKTGKTNSQGIPVWTYNAPPPWSPERGADHPNFEAFVPQEQEPRIAFRSVHAYRWEGSWQFACAYGITNSAFLKGIGVYRMANEPFADCKAQSGRIVCEP